MEGFQNLMMGFSIALTPQNLMFAFIGSFMGTMIGVLPGIGPAAGTAILIPLTFQLEPIGAIIMLAAIYYGAQYGGTITSVLMNVPGEAASVITCIDGYPLAKKGRAGVALSMAAIGSYIGGTLATIGLCIAAPPLTKLALQFGPPQQFALMALGLSLLMALAGKSVIKALMMGVLGLLLAMIGLDPNEGIPRYTFGFPELLGGLNFLPVVMGLFGIGEIFITMERSVLPIIETKMMSLIPSRQDIGDSVGPITRGTIIGFFLGIVPGMQPSLASFMAYIGERKVSKTPEKFGEGALEGVVGPETANNSFCNAAFIPLFTLGIPTTPTIAILMGAFMMNGLIPGPSLFQERPDVVWAVIASLYIGNVMLLILNLPLIGFWVQILRIPYSILFAVILTFTLVGSYSINNSVFDVGTMVLFGVLGYFLKKMDFPLAPAILTLVLGPLMEKMLRASLQMSEGNFNILWSNPISATLLGIAILTLLLSGLRALPFGANAAREDNE